MYGQYGQQGGGDYSYGQTGYSANSDQPYYMQYGGGQNVAQPAAQQYDNFSANPFDEPPQNPYQQDTTLGGFYDEPAPVYHPSDPYSQPYSNAAFTISDQYDVADSHANPEDIAQNQNLPQPSGYEQTFDLTNEYRIQGEMIGDVKSTKKKKKKSDKEKKFYQLGYYKDLFDFETDEIIRRTFSAMNPVLFGSFWEETKDRPDMYIPIWGTTTLWFLLVACGDLAVSLTSEKCQFEGYDFAKVGWGSFACYGYIFWLPLVWFLMFRFWLEIPLGFFDNMCLYGYSLLPYIPTMFLGIMPWSFVRWILFGLSCALSTAFLLRNYYPYLKSHLTPGLVILGVMTIFSVGLGILFEWYFFDSC